jgi:lipopolysaccharide assembly protein A
MRTLVWLFRAAVFFVLFAFALNNREEASIHWFFGQVWQAPMVLIVLAAFGLGCAFGIFAMVPSWWRHRRLSRNQMRRASDKPVVAAPTAATAETAELHPPRDGL